jgi:hypothetical protein
MKRVYFIKPIGFDGPIKIGCSASPTGRAENLALWSPFPLEVLAEIEGGFDIERRFHAKFYDDHRGHEWFTISPDLLSLISEVKSGVFDIDTLPPPRSLARSARKGRGRKWTDEEKASVRRRNALKKAEKASGLVLDYPHSIERADAFIANPCEATGGVTDGRRRARAEARVAAYHRRLAQQVAA